MTQPIPFNTINGIPHALAHPPGGSGWSYDDEEEEDYDAPAPTTQIRGIDDEGDEYIPGGAPAVVTGVYTDRLDADAALDRTMRIRPLQSHRVDALISRSITDETPEQRAAEHARIRAIIAAHVGDGPIFTVDGLSRCTICCIHDATHAVTKNDADYHKLRKAYLAMKAHDLRFCGFKQEEALFHDCAQIFNDLSGQYAIETGTYPVVVTPAEVATHLRDHDFSNPKRDIMYSIIKNRRLEDAAYRGCIGVAADGSTVLRHAAMAAWRAHIERGDALNSRFLAASMYVHEHLLGEDPATLLHPSPSEKKTQKRGAYAVSRVIGAGRRK